MSRRDWEDDRPAEPPRPPNRSTVIVVLVVVGVLALIPCLAVGAFALLWTTAESDRSRPPGVEAFNAEGQRIYSREEFQALVIGKTPKELTDTVGGPDTFQETPDGQPVMWYYRERVTNPATGRPSHASLDFADGKVQAVRW